MCGGSKGFQVSDLEGQVDDGGAVIKAANRLGRFRDKGQEPGIK